MPSAKRRLPNWSRPLPEPLRIGGEITVSTLSDVRRFMVRHLPKGYGQLPQWRTVTLHLEEAAAGASPEEVATALVLAFAVEGVACRPAKEKPRPAGRLRRGSISRRAFIRHRRGITQATRQLMARK
jgi:hypothetical protein